jgi:Potential Queuosine, Q, salvage protein family
MNPLERLRTSVTTLAPRARWVRCDEARLRAYVDDASRRDQQPRFDPTLSDVGDAEARLAFVLMRDATNFGSGYHPVLRKRPGLSGARTTGIALAEHFRTHGPPSADWLAKVTARECAQIFHQDEMGDAGELMGLFATAWNQLGRHLTEYHAGRFDGLLNDAGGSALRLVEKLTMLSFFRDVCRYDGSSFPFLKRAQLAAYDLSLALPADRRAQFADLAELTIFADNLVPHVLKVDGVLVFDPALDARIDAGELLSSGSAEEVEIRALAVYATERLVELCRERRDDVIPLQLSDWLWHRGQLPRYKQRARHRCRCVYY